MRRKKKGIGVGFCACLLGLSLSVSGCGAKKEETRKTETGQGTENGQKLQDGQETENGQKPEAGQDVENGQQSVEDVQAVETGGGKQEKRTVGISMPDASDERWKKDGQDMEKRLTGAGFEVVLYDAQGTVEKQEEDIGALLEKDIDLLIVGAVDAEALGDVMDKAAEQAVTVISYDKLLMNTDAVDYYVSFDHYRVGKGQGDFVIEQLGLTEDMIGNESGEKFTMRVLAEEGRDLQSFYLYQGMEDALVSYMWGENPVLKVVEDAGTDVDVRLEQCLEETDDGEGDRYIVGIAVGNGAYTWETEGKQLFYEDSSREAKITCLLVEELFGNGTVTASFLEKLDDTCRFDRHSYDNGTGIIPAFLVAAEMIPAAPSVKLR